MCRLRDPHVSLACEGHQMKIVSICNIDSGHCFKTIKFKIIVQEMPHDYNVHVCELGIIMLCVHRAVCSREQK